MKTLAPSWTEESLAGALAGSPARPLIMVVGYDGFLISADAPDQAAKNALLDRRGSLEVVFVADLPVGATFSVAAVAEVREGLDEEARALAEEVGGRLAGHGYPWDFQRRGTARWQPS